MPNPIINRRIVELSSGAYVMKDSDAIAYVTAISDIPTNSNYREAIDRLVIGHKSNSLWTSLQWAFISPPTMSILAHLTNIKDAVLNGSASVAGNLVYPQNFPSGMAFESLRTQRYQPNVTITSTADSSAFIWANLENKAQSTGDAFGALNVSASQAFIVQERNASDNVVGRAFDSTNQINSTNSTTKNLCVLNRNASNYLEYVKAGSVTYTNTGIHTGTVPTRPIFLGCLNNNATASNYTDGIYPLFANYLGLSLTDRAIVIDLWEEFFTIIGLMSGANISFSYKVILDGNSLTTYDGDGGGSPSHRMIKKCLYDLASVNKIPVARSIGLGGQVSSTLNTNFASKVVPLLDAAANTIYIPWEITNDFRANGNTTTAESNYWTLCDTAQAAGFTVIAVTIVARDFTGNAAGLSETDYNLGMNTINQSIRANWASHADYLCDITNINLWVDRSNYASDAAYNTAISTIVNNATYYLDGTHLKNTGYDIVATTLYNVLNRII